jgi:hypothetical protein
MLSSPRPTCTRACADPQSVQRARCALLPPLPPRTSQRGCASTLTPGPFTSWIASSCPQEVCSPHLTDCRAECVQGHALCPPPPWLILNVFGADTLTPKPGIPNRLPDPGVPSPSSSRDSSTTVTTAGASQAASDPLLPAKSSSSYSTLLGRATLEPHRMKKTPGAEEG